MESLMNNGWISLPTFQDLNQDHAIRQFCPARVDQQQQQQVEEQQWPDMFLQPHFINNQEIFDDHLIDSFFNVECFDNDNNKQEIDALDHMMIDYYGSIELEGSTSSDDLCFDPVPINGVDEGLHLVHLLLACAEAVGCRDAHLADSILAQIWPCVSPCGDSLQRVSHCFAMGLKSRLSLLQHVHPNGSFANRAMDVSLVTREEKSEAFALLHRTTPYIAFGFVAANEAILQAASMKEFLHIVDLGMEHNLQWPSLVRNLAVRPEGPPKKIRLTAIIGDQDPIKIESCMMGLCEEAISLGISLVFELVQENVSPLSFTKEKLNLREEETLFVNSIMHLHKHVKESRGSLKTILQSIKKLKPTLVTVVEQDANHNGPFFLGRFLESLHYYSAIFDSLDASLPRTSPQRMMIEKVHFAEEIRNVVAYEGSDRIERHERADQWRRQLGRAGFQVVGLKSLEQAKMMISSSGYGCDGYTVASEKGCLQLGWKGRPVMLASAWQVPSS